MDASCRRIGPTAAFAARVREFLPRHGDACSAQHLSGRRCRTAASVRSGERIGLVTLEELNSLSDERATAAFTACCGAKRWVSAMVERRPFASPRDVIDSAAEVWRGMNEADWREAFDHHPRIGEAKGAAVQ